MTKRNGIIINGEWLGNRVVLNDLFRTICFISPVIMLEFTKIINKLCYGRDLFTIQNFDFSDKDTILIEFSSKKINGKAFLTFEIIDNELSLKTATYKVTPFNIEAEIFEQMVVKANLASANSYIKIDEKEEKNYRTLPTKNIVKSFKKSEFEPTSKNLAEENIAENVSKNTIEETHSENIENNTASKLDNVSEIANNVSFDEPQNVTETLTNKPQEENLNNSEKFENSVSGKKEVKTLEAPKVQNSNETIAEKEVLPEKELKQNLKENNTAENTKPEFESNQTKTQAGVNEGVNQGVNEGVNQGVNEDVNKEKNEIINQDVNEGTNEKVNSQINEKQAENIDTISEAKTDEVSATVEENNTQVFDTIQETQDEIVEKITEDTELNETLISGEEDEEKEEINSIDLSDNFAENEDIQNDFENIEENEDSVDSILDKLNEKFSSFKETEEYKVPDIEEFDDKEEEDTIAEECFIGLYCDEEEFKSDIEADAEEYFVGMYCSEEDETQTEDNIATEEESEPEPYLAEIENLKQELNKLKEASEIPSFKEEFWNRLKSAPVTVIENEDADFKILSTEECVNAAILDSDTFLAGEKIYRWGETLYLED
ncbi:MAG: hypothetical protein E7Z89_05885 [Cyanobacteria bacterium SIG28]|nr:hypothetical protein [Cyanobacteria bacterium SIG28]